MPAPRLMSTSANRTKTMIFMIMGKLVNKISALNFCQQGDDKYRVIQPDLEIAEAILRDHGNQAI